jgi:hypothetical protein
MFQKNMECAQLSIKEETEDETRYGSYGLHPDTGVLGEASTKVNVRQIRSSFIFLFCTFLLQVLPFHNLLADP